MQTPVTYLFVPGNRPDRFAKALGSGADAVILDLEDAVSPADKHAARERIGQWMASQTGDVLDRVLVRINDATSTWFEEDLRLLRRAGVRAVMLPKAESTEQVEAVRSALPAGNGVVPLIETARGVANVGPIAAAAGVQRLAFGTLDYAVDLDLSGDDRGFIYPASMIAIASRCAAVTTPIAGVTAALDDDERLLADLACARALGFGAKLCIHPKQVAVIRQAMLPTAAEIEWAQRVLSAVEVGTGAIQIDGRMVDRPVLLKARAILDRA